MNTYYALLTILGSEYTQVNQTDKTVIHGAYIMMRGKDNRVGQGELNMLNEGRGWWYK